MFANVLVIECVDLEELEKEINREISAGRGLLGDDIRRRRQESNIACRAKEDRIHKERKIIIDALKENDPLQVKSVLNTDERICLAKALLEEWIGHSFKPLQHDDWIILLLKAGVPADDSLVQKIIQLKHVAIFSTWVECATSLPEHVVYWILKANSFKMLQLLLDDNRFDVNAKLTFGDQPLHMAIEFWDLEAVILLLKHSKIELNGKNMRGQTPVKYARELKKTKHTPQGREWDEKIYEQIITLLEEKNRLMPAKEKSEVTPTSSSQYSSFFAPPTSSKPSSMLSTTQKNDSPLFTAQEIENYCQLSQGSIKEIKIASFGDTRISFEKDHLDDFRKCVIKFKEILGYTCSNFENELIIDLFPIHVKKIKTALDNNANVSTIESNDKEIDAASELYQLT